MPTRSHLSILPALVLAIALRTQAQDTTHAVADETMASVPALEQFHEVIYQIWHTGWPEKDIPLLKSLAPDVRRFSDSLSVVPLPGILRDRETRWRAGTGELAEIAGVYERAAASSDSSVLLDAAERLHANYEALVRVIRPPLKEIEEFHQVLYMVYHHYIPAKDRARLAAAVPRLQEKMALLDSVRLPERQKKREGAFTEARAKLSASVAALSVPSGESDLDGLIAAIESVHADYQMLEKVFE